MQNEKNLLAGLKALKLKGRIIRDPYLGNIIKTKDGEFFRVKHVIGSWVKDTYHKQDPTKWHKIPIRVEGDKVYIKYSDLRKQCDIERNMSHAKEYGGRCIYDGCTKVVNRLLDFHGLNMYIKHMTFEGKYDLHQDVYNENGFNKDEYYKLLNGAVDICSGRVGEDWQDGKMKYYPEKGNISMMISGESFQKGVLITKAACKTGKTLIIDK